MVNPIYHQTNLLLKIVKGVNLQTHLLINQPMGKGHLWCWWALPIFFAHRDGPLVCKTSCILQKETWLVTLHGQQSIVTKCKIWQRVVSLIFNLLIPNISKYSKQGRTLSPFIVESVPGEKEEEDDDDDDVDECEHHHNQCWLWSRWRWLVRNASWTSLVPVWINTHNRNALGTIEGFKTTNFLRQDEWVDVKFLVSTMFCWKISRVLPFFGPGLVPKILAANHHLNVREDTSGHKTAEIWFLKRYPFLLHGWSSSHEICYLMGNVNPGLINPVYGCLIGGIP